MYKIFQQLLLYL